MVSINKAAAPKVDRLPNADHDYVARAAPSTMLHGFSAKQHTGLTRDAAGHMQSGENDVKTKHVETELKAPARAHFSRKVIEQHRKKRRKGACDDVGTKKAINTGHRTDGC